MEIQSLRKVRKSVDLREIFMYGPMTAYLVNSDAPVAYPRKFIYKGCTKLVENGRPCGKTVEGQKKCEHGSLISETWAFMYRFDIFLVDGSIGSDCPPLRAGIFNAATGLLGMTPPFFNQKAETEQLSIVHGVLNKMPLVEIYVRVKASNATIQSLDVLPDMECHISDNPLYPMPQERTPTTLYILRGEASTTSVSSSRDRGGSASQSQLNSLKAKLLDVISTLNLDDI
ncbi:unnamed protein product [Calypogeia fissa]